VERLAIEGRDLEIVERVTGRLDAGRAALAGGAPGALAGAAFGLPGRQPQPRPADP
jgi:hypothetical protein